MNKVFIVAGETSGDLVGGWFLNNHSKKILPENCYFEGIGGDSLTAAGVTLYRSYTELNLVGLFEIIKKIPSILRMINTFADYIITHNFTYVVLIDFPGFNLRLAQQLKKRNAAIKIIYLSPPQLWCWGEWKLKTLRAVSDEIVVIFPFEVAWYRQRGVVVRYLGNPTFDRLMPAIKQQAQHYFRLGVFPGSRRQELALFVPLLTQVVGQLLKKFPSLEIMVFQAPHLDEAMLAPLVSLAPNQITIVPFDQRIALMQTCAVALSKAGTVTLELGLLQVPTVIFYKAHWLSYWIAKKLVSINRMGLPNLIAQQDLMPEFIQYDCTTKNLVDAVAQVLTPWLHEPLFYNHKRQKLIVLERLFTQTA